MGLKQLGIGIVAMASAAMVSATMAQAAATPAENTVSTEASTGFDLLDFRLSQYSVFEAGGGKSYAGWGGWTPSYLFTPQWGARLQAGLGILKSSASATEPFFALVDLAALGVYQLNDSIALEAGPGAQLWVIGGSSKYFSLTAGGVYTFKERLLWIFEGVSLNYTAAFQTNNLSHQIRVGAVF
jgi:hypothetical protein